MASTPLTVNVTPIVGVSDLVLFPVTEDTKTTLTTDDANLIDLSECVVSKAYAPQMAEGDFYSSNKKQKSVKSNKGGTVTYVIPAITPALKERVLGAKKNTAGATVQGSNDVSPEYICAHKVKLTDDVWVLEKYAKVVFATPSEKAETENENINYQTAELVGTVVPLNYEVAFTGGSKNGGFLFSVQSDDEKYTDLESAWFTSGTAGIKAGV
ncbi:major tail protein [Clostridium sp. D33t1_170424_F3]|uniref:major tail protein n=1 Tax=Clostridium sp. D33t1_170424_F3 TaxID=2787099 RepID=UPI0018AA009E|nr:major tail protein [Clostridium sp. D33t1_170424_F3]